MADRPVDAPEEGEIPDFGKKHPLENRWTLWFDNPSKNSKQSSATWGQSLRAVYTFDTVEDFWWCAPAPAPPPPHAPSRLPEPKTAFSGHAQTHAMAPSELLK